MKKQALIQLHRLYLETTDFLGGDLEDTAYDESGMGIHGSRDDHWRALCIISEYLGDNFEDIKQTNWECGESFPEPDVDFGNVALYKEWEGNEHDRIEFGYSDAESIGVNISDSGKHRKKYEAMDYLAQGDSLDEAIEQTYSDNTRRNDKWNLLNEKVLDEDGRLPKPEEVNKVLEKVEE